jgi:hypothetical protein
MEVVGTIMVWAGGVFLGYFIGRRCGWKAGEKMAHLTTRTWQARALRAEQAHDEIVNSVMGVTVRGVDVTENRKRASASRGRSGGPEGVPAGSKKEVGDE